MYCLNWTIILLSIWNQHPTRRKLIVFHNLQHLNLFRWIRKYGKDKACNKNATHGFSFTISPLAYVQKHTTVAFASYYRSNANSLKRLALVRIVLILLYAFTLLFWWFFDMRMSILYNTIINKGSRVSFTSKDTEIANIFKENKRSRA